MKKQSIIFPQCPDSVRRPSAIMRGDQMVKNVTSTYLTIRVAREPQSELESQLESLATLHNNIRIQFASQQRFIMYLYLFGLVSLLVVINYYFLTKNYRYCRERKSVPHLKGAIPDLGNVYPLFLMRKNIFQMYQEIYEKMPGHSLVGFFYGTEPALLIRDPEVVKLVLQTNFVSFALNGMHSNPELDGLSSRNPFFLQGLQWKSTRQQLSSAFTSGKLEYTYESINAVCAKYVKYLDNKVERGSGKIEVELKKLFSRYTAEIVASAAFGIEGNSFDDAEGGTFVKFGKSIFEPSLIHGIKLLAAMFVPFLAKIFRPGIIPSEVDKVFRNLVKVVLGYRADQNVQRPDFLQLMIDYKKTGGSDHGISGEFNDDTITAHLASFFIEGYETSSIALSFAVYELASHPEIQQHLRDEVLTVIGKHNGITYEALQELTYMDKVLSETLRLYPPAGALYKVCTEEIDLKGSDGVICPVVAVTHVMISVSGIQKDPEYWPDPEKFDPERFSEENKHNRHRFTYLSFGEGPRVCIGIRMAMLQMKAALATTIKKYSIELLPKTQVPIKLDLYHFMASAVGGL